MTSSLIIQQQSEFTPFPEFILDHLHLILPLLLFYHVLHLHLLELLHLLQVLIHLELDVRVLLDERAHLAHLGVTQEAQVRRVLVIRRHQVQRGHILLLYTGRLVLGVCIVGKEAH
ncbi:hypothetical protein FGO68_gene4012 [Halteria grandinella]|uniref:Uncharacterized protein n=1 Tax=Halteria grandinella TaxID=5974 RepID=A0A8J8P2A1_HALGN|nr:hypothetical protein FGO68_gene4012 [Halteria grandinella]